MSLYIGHDNETKKVKSLLIGTDNGIKEVKTGYTWGGGSILK